MNRTEIKARELIIESIGKMIEKYKKKAEKEKAKRDTATVTYNGETYYSESELQDAYGCDCFSSAVYDRLLNKLEKARGNIDSDQMTESEILVYELNAIKNNFREEITHDQAEKMRKERQEKRFAELSAEGYSYKECVTIIGNEELMKFE